LGLSHKDTKNNQYNNKKQHKIMDPLLDKLGKRCRLIRNGSVNAEGKLCYNLPTNDYYIELKFSKDRVYVNKNDTIIVAK